MMLEQDGVSEAWCAASVNPNPEAAQPQKLSVSARKHSSRLFGTGSAYRAIASTHLP